MDDYIHDVFIRYKQDKDWNDWMEQLFFASLNHSLRRVMSNHRLPRICFDRTNFLVGEPLTETVRINVIKSRVLVCLWTPEYFESEWCRKELTIMLQRRSIHDNRRLILPVGIRDGQRFPDLIHQLNLLKLEAIQNQRLANPMLNKRTQQAYDLSVIIDEWVETSVYPAILSAPDYDPSWETMKLDEALCNNLKALPEDPRLPSPHVIF